MTTEALREKILSVASELFAEKGYDAVSMRHIATAVGMAQANLYYYFKDKEDIIRSSLAFVFVNKTGQLLTSMQESIDPRIRLELFVTNFLKLLFEDRVFSQLLFRELLINDESRLEFLTKNVFQDAFNVLVEIVGDYFEADNPILSATSLLGIVVWHYQFSGVVKYLYDGRLDCSDQKTIIRHIMGEVQCRVKKQFRNEV